jgi:calcineurin-like phosphoesterase
MTGVLDGIIGMDTQICLNRAKTQVLYRMETAKPSDGQRPAIQGIIAEIDGDTRKTVSIERIV